MTSPIVPTRALLERRLRVLEEVLGGLAGKPFEWGAGRRACLVRAARDVGVELLTIAQLEKRGAVVRRGAEAVGTAAHPARNQRGPVLGISVGLFVFGLQTRPAKPRPKSATRRQLKLPYPAATPPNAASE